MVQKELIANKVQGLECPTRLSKSSRWADGEFGGVRAAFRVLDKVWHPPPWLEIRIALLAETQHG